MLRDRREIVDGCSDHFFVEFCQFSSNHDGAHRLIFERFGQFLQCLFDPVHRFIENDGALFGCECFEERLSPFFERQKSEIDELMDRQAARAEGGEKSRWARDHFDLDAGFRDSGDDGIARITDARRAGVTRQAEMFSFLELGENHRQSAFIAVAVKTDQLFFGDPQLFQ